MSGDQNPSDPLHGRIEPQYPQSRPSPHHPWSSGLGPLRGLRPQAVDNVEYWALTESSTAPTARQIVLVFLVTKYIISRIIPSLSLRAILLQSVSCPLAGLQLKYFNGMRKRTMGKQLGLQISSKLAPVWKLGKMPKGGTESKPAGDRLQPSVQQSSGGESCPCPYPQHRSVYRSPQTLGPHLGTLTEDPGKPPEPWSNCACDTVVVWGAAEVRGIWKVAKDNQGSCQVLPGPVRREPGSG